MRFTAAAAIVAALLLETCPHCAEPERLCEAHAKEESQTFEETRDGLQSKDENVRAAAVAKIGALHSGRENVPSRRVTEALAIALGDKSSLVRLAAAQALDTPQHAETALPTLIRALERERPKIVDAAFDAESLSDQVRRQLDPKGPKPSEAERNRMKEVASSRLACATIVGALGRYPDDRAVAAVVKQLRFAQEKTNDSFLGATRCVESLFRLGARTGIEESIAALEREERRSGSAAKERRGFKTSLADALHKGATGRGFTAVPPARSGTAAEWRSFLGKHREEFPAKLGTLALRPESALPPPK